MLILFFNSFFDSSIIMNFNLSLLFVENNLSISFANSSFPNDFSCESLTGAIFYLDNSENFIALHNFTNKDFLKEDLLRTCRLKFNVDELF